MTMWTRREFGATAAGVVGASAARRPAARAKARPAGPLYSDLHHIDTPSRLLNEGLDLAESPDYTHVDIPKMRQGGLTAGFFAVSTPARRGGANEVPRAGIEPARPEGSRDFKSRASTSFATSAWPSRSTCSVRLAALDTAPLRHRREPRGTMDEIITRRARTARRAVLVGLAAVCLAVAGVRGAAAQRAPGDGAHHGYLAARIGGRRPAGRDRRVERRPLLRARVGAQGRDGGGRPRAPRDRVPLAHPADVCRRGRRGGSRRRPRHRAGGRPHVGARPVSGRRGRTAGRVGRTDPRARDHPHPRRSRGRRRPFPGRPHPLDRGFGDLPYRHGTPPAPLAVDEATITVRVAPGPSIGAPARVEAPDGVSVINLTTTAGRDRHGAGTLDFLPVWEPTRCCSAASTPSASPRSWCLSATPRRPCARPAACERPSARRGWPSTVW